MNTYGSSILMLKKAITDTVALKKGMPRKYDYGLKLETNTLNWLKSIGLRHFPLARLNIGGFHISSLSYYIGILLDIPPIHDELLDRINRKLTSDIKITTLTVALDVLDRLLMVPEWEEKAKDIIIEAYRYILSDFFSDSSELLSAMNILTMAKVADKVELHSSIREKVLKTIHEYGAVGKEEMKYIFRLHANNNIPPVLWLSK